MERSINEIKNLINAEQSGHPELSALNNPSQTSEFNLWKDVFASQTNTTEQLWNELVATLESKLKQNASATDLLIMDRVLNHFQYDASNPQVLQIIDGVVTYPTINHSCKWSA